MIAPTARPVPPRLVCIDPGSTASGVVVYDGAIPSGPVVYAAKVENGALLEGLRSKRLLLPNSAEGHAVLTGPHVMVVEMMRARGMPMSNDELRTLLWLGRFIEAWGGPWDEVWRSDVKMHVCGRVAANDANIRAALIDKHGGKAVALAYRRKCDKCKGTGTFGIGRGSKRTTNDCHACGKTGMVGTDGPLHGVKADAWSALALGITYTERGGSRAAKEA